MIRDDGATLAVVGPMTMASAKALLAQGRGLLRGGETVFDLAQVDKADSAALAVIFGWHRSARAAGNSLRVINPPENLKSLADLYGVAPLLAL